MSMLRGAIELLAFDGFTNWRARQLVVLNLTTPSTVTLQSKINLSVNIYIETKTIYK